MWVRDGSRWARCVTRDGHETVGCDNFLARVTAPYGGVRDGSVGAVRDAGRS
ncbi:hypothetical protein [Baaleninema simplex]|uniref:hypothetical protein n=1 Tax=Baaleninema simplex TaxID=2862350 RepID=UPI00130EA162|nr:hypothetical protein [Baaleninema simplex]